MKHHPTGKNTIAVQAADGKMAGSIAAGGLGPRPAHAATVPAPNAPNAPDASDVTGAPDAPLAITNPRGRTFHATIVPVGGTYGRTGALTNDGEPMIEFYDATHTSATNPRGQFVSRYYLATLENHDPTAGLCLDGGAPEWTLSAANVADALTYAHTQLATEHARTSTIR